MSRELALCYYLLKNQEQAMKFVKEGLSRYGDNEYLVDLWVQIALRKRDEEDALKALEILRLISEESYYYHHRASRVALSFGDIERAHEEADVAVSLVDELITKRKGFSPPLEVMVQLVHCKIRLGDPDNLDLAEKMLISLDKVEENVHDVGTGLWCQLRIARGDFRGAYKQLRDIRDKHTIFYWKLKRDALLGLVSLPDMPPSKREDYKRDISYLETRLQGARPEEFIPAEININDLLL